MRIMLILCLFHVSVSAEPTEAELNRQFCQAVNGQTETRHYYTCTGGCSHIRVDCETATMVYEGGLDKRSSLDSIQQALFASYITGKRPVSRPESAMRYIHDRTKNTNITREIRQDC